MFGNCCLNNFPVLSFLLLLLKVEFQHFSVIFGVRIGVVIEQVGRRAVRCGQNVVATGALRLAVDLDKEALPDHGSQLDLGRRRTLLWRSHLFSECP